MRALTGVRPGRPSILVLSGLAMILVPAVLAQPALAQPAGASPLRSAAHTPSAPSVWQIQKTPNPQVKDEAFTGISCTSSTNCVAVGDRLNDESTPVSLAELWNGTKWKMMSTPNAVGAESHQLSSVSCASPGDCVAVGYDFVGNGSQVPIAESWNGTSWSLDTVPIGVNGGGLNGVSCPTTTQCIAVGALFDKNGSEKALAESWNGTTWTELKVAKPSDGVDASFSSVSCSSVDECEAVGGYEGDSEEGVTLAEIWNGASWAIQKTPNPKQSSYSDLAGVSCVSASDCVAVGFGSPITQSGSTSLAEAWNGTTWTLMATPNPAGSEGVTLFSVSCSSADACAAVGLNSVGNQVNDTLAMTWNGETWTIETSPNPSPLGAELNGVACTSPTSCTSVGLTFGSKSPELLLVENWDGTTWSIQKAHGEPGLISAGLSGVSCLSDSFCLAVGTDEFQNPIAEIWNGTSWKLTPAPVGTGGGGLYDVSCVSTTDCIAVGPINEGELSLIQQWNGSSWVPMKSPFEAGPLESISCASATSCMTVGSTFGETGAEPVAESWNGKKWTDTQIQSPAGTFQLFMQGVSCASASSCVAVGTSFGDRQVASPLIYAWDGSKWTIQKSASTKISNLSLTGVSCVSSTDCVAVGYTTDKLLSPGAFSEIWNGSTWASVKIPTPTGGAEPEDIQCSSATACVTVGARGRGALAEGWDGTAWTVEKIDTPAGSGVSAGFEKVSCTAPAACTAVGSYSNSSGFELPLAEGN